MPRLRRTSRRARKLGMTTGENRAVAFGGLSRLAGGGERPRSSRAATAEGANDKAARDGRYYTAGRLKEVRRSAAIDKR
jgi:hypothetical protein